MVNRIVLAEKGATMDLVYPAESYKIGSQLPESDRISVGIVGEFRSEGRIGI